MIFLRIGFADVVSLGVLLGLTTINLKSTLDWNWTQRRASQPAAVVGGIQVISENATSGEPPEYFRL